jgi:radical SAM protein with 4Fe4S-binding SPASM domain
MREFVDQQTLAGEQSERIERYFAEAREAAHACGITLRLPRTQPRPQDRTSSGRARCDWPWTGGYISYDGIAMPCCMVATPDRANFGSVTDRRFADVWNSERYEEFRRALASGTPPEICRTCAVYTGTF